MKISKIRNVKTPNRGTDLSAGIDFYVPKFDKCFKEDLINKNNGVLIVNDRIGINSNQRILIPSGIKVNFQGENKALIAFNKSGVSSEKGLDVLACVIDQDYQGEIHISLVNTSNSLVYIYEEEKIIQMLLVPVFYDNIEIVKEEELWINKTLRGDGGFGSTNK